MAHSGTVFLGVGIIYETIFSDARQLLLFITHCVLIAFVEFACAVGLPQENVSLFSFIGILTFYRMYVFFVQYLEYPEEGYSIPNLIHFCSAAVFASLAAALYFNIRSQKQK